MVALILSLMALSVMAVGLFYTLLTRRMLNIMADTEERHVEYNEYWDAVGKKDTYQKRSHLYLFIGFILLIASFIF